MSDIITAACLVGGALFALAAAIGLLRLPDVFIRMHAATKARTLGVGLIMAAVAAHFGETGVITRAIAGIAFLIITAPVAAHLIGRAAYREGVPMWTGTVLDEWRQHAETHPDPELSAAAASEGASNMGRNGR